MEKNDKTDYRNKGSRRNKNNNRSGRKTTQERCDKEERMKGQGEMSREKGFNDPSWYIPTDQLAKDVATFQMNYPLGNAIPSDVSQATQIVNDVGNVVQPYALGNRVPGIISYQLIPQVGMSRDAQSALNIASTNLYAYVRHQNSGAKNYDAVDLTQMIIAVAQAYSAVTWLQRVYGYANTFSSVNRYIPKALISSNHLNPESIYANLADFRARINLLSLKLNSIYAPNTVKLFNRWVFIYSAYYTDSDTARAQMFQYVPYGFLKRDDTTGNLNLVKLEDNMSYIDACNYVSELIEVLLSSEDVGIMSGDILKAWGSSVYSMSYIPDNYSIMPSKVDEVRSQFENVVCVPLSNSASYAIVQDSTKSYLKTDYNLSMSGSDATHVGGFWLNFHKQEPSSEDVIVATRLLPGIGSLIALDDHKWKVSLSSVGSELCVGMYISAFDTMGSLQQISIHSAYTIHNGKEGVSMWVNNHAYVLAKITALSSFDWAPSVTLYQYLNGVDTIKALDSYKGLVGLVGVIQDVDQGTYLSKDNIDRLNDTAIMGLFGIPIHI